METILFSSLPDSAKHIRESVFMHEQGFVQEFDALDEVATHIVVFDGDIPVATCRIWLENNGYRVGRLAVIKDYRGAGLGRFTLEQAEAHVRSLGGNAISLHAQCRAEKFYRKCGYTPYGGIDYEEGVEHVHMRKSLD